MGPDDLRPSYNERRDVETINYGDTTKPLILEQLKRVYGPDNAQGGGSNSGASTVAVVTFPRYSFTSNVVPIAITDVSKLSVEWTTGQENKGQLVYGTDFTVSSNRIVLTNGSGGTTDWTPTCAANALGLLSLTVSQES